MSNKSNAWSRFGYGRLNKETVMTEPINPETINNNDYIQPEPYSKEQAAVDALVDSYRKLTAEQAEKTTEQEENVMQRMLTPIWEPPLQSNSVLDKAKRYELQESKRAPKVQVDQRLVLLSWIIAVGIAFVSSALVSYNGITAVAAFVGLSNSWMSGLFFFFIELMYLVFLVAYLVLASRVDDDGVPEKTWGAMAGMVAFGGIAVLANGFHTLDFWAWDITNPQVWDGVVLSVAAPIAIISASKMASRVVFAKALKL